MAACLFLIDCDPPYDLNLAAADWGVTGSLPMTKRYIFTLFCAAALFARVSTADAYTVIVVSSSKQGGERYEYRHPVSAAAGASTSHHMSADLSRSTIEHSTLERCRNKGGINPKIVLSTGNPGYFAIAVGFGSKEHFGIVGWSGPLASPEAAASEAIANCKQRGGTDPQIREQWGDFGSHIR